MKLMAMIPTRCYNDGIVIKGKPWQEVKEVTWRYPSGMRDCVMFNDGKVTKIEDCKLCYVF
jgi:hypothetical protein